VVSGVCDGFIGNRMIEQYGRQGGFLLDEGCTPEQVDKAIEKFGIAMGPFRMGDLAGNDIGWAIRKRRYQEKPDMKYSKTADLLCEKGRFGQKTGAGWYDYVPGKRDAIPNAEVVKMIEDHRKAWASRRARSRTKRSCSAWCSALVNEAAHILEEGIANKASDIDVVYIFGYGFPVYRGGPLNYANEVGLFNVVQAMKRFAKNPLDDAKFWEPAPLLAKLAAEGKTF
jgi:3-hydroxyacyl-CoA dehydrogenase